MNIIPVETPTRTFRARWSLGQIAGRTDGLEAMKQAIYIILNVERYKYIIHSWNFGIELADLFGKPIPFVIPELKRRITEALLWDKRIKAVSDFSFEVRRGVVKTTFTATTIFGDVRAEKAVDV